MPLAAANFSAQVPQQPWDQLEPRAARLQADLATLAGKPPDPARSAAVTSLGQRLSTTNEEARRLTQIAADLPADAEALVAQRARVRLAAEELTRAATPPPPPPAAGGTPAS